MSPPTKLYAITCTTNGKLYVGITSRDMDVRWKEHVKSYKGQQPSSVVHKAMRKHGLQAFTVEVLHEYSTAEEAAHAEIQLIANLELMRRGYNAGPGGDVSPTTGVGHTDAVRAKLSNMARLQFSTAEAREKLRQRAKAQMSDPRNRERVANALRGRPLSEEHRRKVGDAHRGRRRSLETRAKMSKAATGRKRPDVALRCAGVARSAEERTRMSAGRLAANQRRLDASVMSHYA